MGDFTDFDFAGIDFSTDGESATLAGKPEKKQSRRSAKKASKAARKAKRSRDTMKSRYDADTAIRDVESGFVKRDDKPRRARRSSAPSDLLRFLMKLGMVLAVIAVMFSFVFGVYRVSDPYMSPSMKDGDLVLYYRLDKNYTAGEVAVVRYQDRNTCCRVAAIEGDTVNIDENGLMINNSYQVMDIAKFGDTTAVKDGVTFPLTVPAHSVFLLADDRNGGIDSRIYGCVNVEDTDGKVMALFRRREL